MGGIKKILVIDDQPDVVEMIAYVLEAEGYQVVSALSGRNGLDRAREYQPDLILCDVMMPGLNGYDVLEEVRGDLQLSATPFIFLTAKASTEDLRTGMRLGADDYLTKPFSADELVAAIETRIRKHVSMQERFEQRIELLRQGLSTTLPHELRTPLTLILAHTSLLLEAYDSFDRDSILDSLKAVNEAGLRLHRLLENLLIYVEMSGDATLPIEHPNIENAGDIATEAARRVAENHKRALDLNLRIENESLHVHGFHLRKIVEELVDNAFKFSQKGTPVHVSFVQEADSMVLTVEDQGRGMSEEEVEKLDAYVQFSRSRFEQQGTGMGLTVVKAIVKLYNGTVDVQGKVGVGTRVQVTLPIS